MDLLALFFNLLRCKDKVLRKFLQEHIITDIKNMNAKHKDVKLNKVGLVFSHSAVYRCLLITTNSLFQNLQNFMYTMLQDRNAKAAKMSLVSLSFEFKEVTTFNVKIKSAICLFAEYHDRIV